MAALSVEDERAALYARLGDSVDALHASVGTLAANVTVADTVNYEISSIAMHSASMLERAATYGGRRSERN